MTAHLLALTVGPVQEFIAAARRTRDLWFGSYLLSEISKAAAKAVGDHAGINKLIFPAPNSGADLKPDSPLNVANVILAELGDVDPAAVAREAKEAARRRWRDFTDHVFDGYKSVIQSDIWNDQVDDVIEFYAAWHPYSETTYKDDRAALMRLLAARKLCRDFAPAEAAPAFRNRRSTACARARFVRRANGPGIRAGACDFSKANSSTLSVWSSGVGSPIAATRAIRRWRGSPPIPGYGS
jgi:CRISPR-associated protein Cmr2, N-terminal